MTTSWFTSAVFDSGWATLVGSAVGAGITVLGSVLVARQQSHSASTAFESLVIATISSVKKEAKKLCDTANRQEIREATRTDYANELKTQVQVLSERVRLFRELSPYSQSNNFSFIVALFKLVDALVEAEQIIEREKVWLDSPTLPVVRNAQGNLFSCGERMFCPCYDFLIGMNFDVGSQSENMVKFDPPQAVGDNDIPF